jgi:hypothetical protein
MFGLGVSRNTFGSMSLQDIWFKVIMDFWCKIFVGTSLNSLQQLARIVCLYFSPMA